MKLLTIYCLMLVTLSGCVQARYCTPRPAKPQSGATYPIPQYVPEYQDPLDSVLPPSRRQPPPLGGPYFSIPPAVQDGLTVTPFIGPDGVALCNTFDGVTICQ